MLGQWVFGSRARCSLEARARNASVAGDDISRPALNPLPVWGCHKPPRTDAEPQTCRDSTTPWALFPYTTEVDVRRIASGDFSRISVPPTYHHHNHGGVSGCEVSRRRVHSSCSKRRTVSTNRRCGSRNNACCFQFGFGVARAFCSCDIGRASQHSFLDFLYLTNVALHTVLHYSDIHNELQLLVSCSRHEVCSCGTDK